MKIVQDALAGTGIPVFAGAWRSTADQPVTPDIYIVYTTMTVETDFADDDHRRYKIYIYLNLWARGDPTDAVRKIRSAMRAAGFGMSQEIDSFDDGTGYMLVACTYIMETEADDGDPG